MVTGLEMVSFSSCEMSPFGSFGLSWGDEEISFNDSSVFVPDLFVPFGSLSPFSLFPSIRAEGNRTNKYMYN